MTKKRAALERDYKRVKAEIMQEREGYCEGCGATGRITFSHRIPRSRNILLLAVKENIDLYCPDCHEAVELGNYTQLNNGEDVKDFIRRIDPEYLELKRIKKVQSVENRFLSHSEYCELQIDEVKRILENMILKLENQSEKLEPNRKEFAALYQSLLNL